MTGFSVVKMQRSGYKYDAVGKGGDIGYMQINQEWHTDRMERLGATDLKNPYQNVRIGIDYMAELLGQYQTSVAVSAYNRGARNDSGTFQRRKHDVRHHER